MNRYIPAADRCRSSRPDVFRRGNLDTSLPKNFDKPLTCFFWHQNGRCNKRDEDCAYAHWNTGHLATAPINLPGGVSAVAVAGNNARNLSATIAGSGASSVAADVYNQEERLRAWERELVEWEMTLREKEEDLLKKAEELRLKERRHARRERALKKPHGGATYGRGKTVT
ncbi:hypothetical protein EK21DRAFT_115323 [Setomelanomma holmii]|uniref:C3H1-type domain-containing protein n=1 Tax=Setomelanomma holmii TaxID=210430 RepID=A0A9P4H2W0_9PLEO|nr:hypothetical protein EK21DRAFT_115323 [Setomelanomma holmii]